MKSFTYRAFTAEGRSRRGEILAEDQTAAAAQLRAQGLFPENIAPQRGGRCGLRRLDRDLQAIFARQMAVLLSAGLPVDEALAAIRATGGGKAMDQVSSRIRALVLDGAPLSEALTRGASGFPPYVTSAVRAGEVSRDLVAVFETIAEHLETQRADRASLATALIYPGFVAAVSCLVCAILMTTVAPEIAAMFKSTGRPLPPLTSAMLKMTDWIGAHFVALVAAAAGLCGAAVLMLRRPAMRDRWHNFLLGLPVIGRLMVLDAAAQYLRTLALVVASRQPVVEGARSASQVLGPARFRAQADQVTAAIQAGARLSSALQSAEFVPPVARQLVEAGEKSSRVAVMTERAATLVENWLINDRKRIATLLDPLLMMLVGLFVLIVVLSVLLPIFDMQSAISPG